MKICPKCGRLGIDDSYMINEPIHCLWKDCNYHPEKEEMKKEFKRVKLPCPFCGKKISIRIWLDDGPQKEAILYCPHCFYRVNFMILRWGLQP